MFQHKRIHFNTWISPDGNTANQIDHILTDSRHASDILDIRACRGPNIDSDHYSVKCTWLARISMANRRGSSSLKPKINIGKLSGENLKEYQKLVNERLQGYWE
jgi:hypothetical protein